MWLIAFSLARQPYRTDLKGKQPAALPGRRAAEGTHETDPSPGTMTSPSLEIALRWLCFFTNAYAL